MSKHKRKLLVVDNPLQARVIKDVGGVAAGVLTLSVVVVGYFANAVVDQIDAAGAAVPGLFPLLLAVFGSICVTSFALMMRALRVSHSIAGPQFSIRRSVDQFVAGDHHVRVKIRTSDYLHSAAQDINRLMDAACGAIEPAAMSAPATATSATTTTGGETQAPQPAGVV